MNKDEIVEQVRSILANTFQLDLNEVTLETHLYTDLDLDSLDAIDMAAELSNRTQLQFDNDDLRNIRTVSDIVETIVRKQNEN